MWSWLLPWGRSIQIDLRNEASILGIVCTGQEAQEAKDAATRRRSLGADRVTPCHIGARVVMVDDVTLFVFRQ